MNLNLNQGIAIVLVVLGVFVASTAQLTDLVGAGPAHTIVSLSGLLMSVLSGILGVITGQSSQVKAVQAMPGVEKITVNEKADATLGALALDPAQDKIEVTAGAQSAVEKTVKEG